MTDHRQAVTDAWTKWRRHPASRAAVVAKEHALASAGLPACWAHDYIADRCRRGAAVADAVRMLLEENPE